VRLDLPQEIAIGSDIRARDVEVFVVPDANPRAGFRKGHELLAITNRRARHLRLQSGFGRETSSATSAAIDCRYSKSASAERASAAVRAAVADPPPEIDPTTSAPLLNARTVLTSSAAFCEQID
jgi:hypothetical protein